MLTPPLPLNTAGFDAPTSTPFTDETYFPIMAEDLCRLAAGGDPSDDDELDPRQAELICRNAADALNAKITSTNANIRRQAFLEQLKLDKESYFEDLKAYYEQGGTSEPYIVAFPNTPVIFDKDREQWFIPLPAKFVDLPRYVNLPREQQATVECMRVRDRTKRRYIPMNATDAKYFMSNHSAGFQGNIGTNREGAILWLVMPPNEEAPDEKVLLKVVIRSREQTLAPEPGYLFAASYVETLSMALQMWQGRGAQDNINDANAQTARK
jgi:hypothetical protein